MKITVVQPAYFTAGKPDETIAKFLKQELSAAQEGSLVVLPEYSNAGGLSDAPSELQALPRAEEMLRQDVKAGQRGKTLCRDQCAAKAER